MRVAILGNYPSHLFAGELGCNPNPQSGISTWLVNLADHLSVLSDMDVHVIAEDHQLRDDCTLYKERITYHFIRPPKRFKRTSFYETNRQRLRKEIQRIQPDILHAHHTDQYAWCAVNESTPAVVTVHGVYRKVARSLSAETFSHLRFLGIVERLCLRKARYLISISPYVIENVADIFQGTVFKIENPIQKIFFECPNRTEPNVILFCAVLSPRKGLSYLVEVLAKLKKRELGVTLRIVGSYPPGLGWYKKEIDDLIKEKGLNDTVYYLGPKDGQGVCDEISKASCLVMTSIEETAPMVISEAMAAGKPVVAFDVGGIRYMIEDGLTGFVIPNRNVSLMAERIAQLLEDEQLRKSMGSVARKSALERFHPDLVAKKTRTVYEEILTKENKK